MEKMLAELTVKMPIELRRQAVAVADAEGVSVSQYVRELIMQDLQKHRRKFVALSSIFGNAGEYCQVLSGGLSGDEAAQDE
jgi:hypothetical protein